MFLASSVAALVTGYLVCGVDPADDHILCEQVGNIRFSVCVSVCLSISLSVCLCLS